MFMGSRNAPYPAFDAIMESWGGHNNGTTSNDRTNYYEIGPRNLLETFLWLEADRLATLPDVITARGAGASSSRWCRTSAGSRTRTAPTAAPSWRIPEAMYPPDHPYHWPTIGSHEDLEAATVDDVRAFFERFYRPSNASLVIAGDFDPAEARALVEKLLRLAAEARAAAGARRTRRRRVLGGRRATITLTDRVQLPRLRLALALAGAVRAGRRRSRSGGARAGRRQVEPPLPLAGVRAAHRPGRRSPTRARRCWAASSTSAPPRSPDTTSPRSARAVDAELARLAADGPTDAELDRARNTHLADFYKSLDHLQTRADLLNHYQYLLGDPDGVERDVARYADGDAARRCATPSPRVVAPESRPAHAARGRAAPSR